MDSDEVEYCVKATAKRNSLTLTIPAPLVKKYKISAGQLMKVSGHDGVIMYETSKLVAENHKKTSKIPKKNTEPETSKENTESKAHHVVDLDDPDFNPINRLAL